MTETLSYDVIIVGSGLAGLRAAISAASKNKSLKIAVISKVQVMRSHSVSAEGVPLLYFMKTRVTIWNHIFMTLLKEVISWLTKM